jgi:uncharacterized phage-associated protein
MPYSSTVIANEFLKLAKAAGKSLTPMKVQKLVYFAHGWYLALTDLPLISERIEAWQYGPVIPDLYREFKYCGNAPITALGTAVRFAGGRMLFESPTLDDYPADEERQKARKIVGRVFEIYGHFSAAQLSNATHMDDSPLQKVYKEGVRFLVIPDETIKSYFRAQARRNDGV